VGPVGPAGPQGIQGVNSPLPTTTSTSSGTSLSAADMGSLIVLVDYGQPDPGTTWSVGVPSCGPGNTVPLGSWFKVVMLTNYGNKFNLMGAYVLPSTAVHVVGSMNGQFAASGVQQIYAQVQGFSPNLPLTFTYPPIVTVQAIYPNLWVAF
jgi:hypothetical protein